MTTIIIIIVIIVIHYPIFILPPLNFSTKTRQVSTAPGWRGPYSNPKTLFPNDGVYNLEDPFIWFDGNMQRWRVLLHVYNMSDSAHQVRVGGYAESDTSDLFGNWTLQSNETPAYNTTVKFTDGTEITLARRERPKLLFDAKTGLPSMLFNGVCDEKSCYTLAQPVDSAGL